MKTKFLFLISIAILLFSCKKEDNNNPDKDYRETVTGKYSGIRVNSSISWQDSIVKSEHNTSEVSMTLSKSDLDSIIDLSFDPEYSNEHFSFKFRDGLFVSTAYYHAPMLKLTNDSSLYFRHQAGLAPIWTECFTKKTK